MIKQIYHAMPYDLILVLAFLFGMVFMVVFIIGGSYITERMVDFMKKGALNNGLYFYLKWITIIVLPALATFIVVISKIWGWGDTGSMIAQTITAVATFLGTILCISNYNYYKGEKKE
jgi:cytochrome c biogenesis factor